MWLLCHRGREIHLAANTPCILTCRYWGYGKEYGKEQSLEAFKVCTCFAQRITNHTAFDASGACF
jgi:hypothetical protein